jgi:hypothetical protein
MPPERFLEIRRLRKILAEIDDMNAEYAGRRNRIILLQRKFSR